MRDDEFETQLAAWYPSGRQTQPAYWHDDAFNNPAQPVVGICWFEARAYCAWLSVQTGQTFRLPTEAEWEAAARGGQRRRYAFGNNFDAARCNTFETHIRRTTPIGVFPGGKTPAGLVDMTGNTWDWTSSLYTTYPYDTADGREAPSPPGACRVGVAVLEPSLGRRARVLSFLPRSRSSQQCGPAGGAVVPQSCLKFCPLEAALAAMSRVARTA